MHLMNSAIFNLHILVVEDVSFMRMLVIQALESVGFSNIHEAEDGEAALQLLAKSPMDLIITDIEMKPMNGLDLIKQVRAGDTPLPRGIPTLILSGMDDTSTLAAASELDVQGFLEKPVSANQLRERIDSAMNAETELRAPEYYRSLVFAAAAQTTARGGHAPDSGYTVRTVERKAPTAPAAVRPSARQNDASPPPARRTQLRRLPMAQLREGMVVREDIMSRGRVLLRKGVVLTPGHLLVLRDMRSLLDQSEVEVETESWK